MNGLALPKRFTTVGLTSGSLSFRTIDPGNT
jgi:hypothetical protein